MSPSVKSGCVAMVVVALTLLACSSKSEDGESCDKNTDCSSGSCISGACQGSECKCDGPDCRGQSTCRAGWLCTRVEATSDEVLPRCRQQCTGPGTCPGDKHCDNGICRTGPETFGLTWLNIPRAVDCSPKVPCEYKVKPSDSAVIDTYTWTFGDAPPVNTTEPTTSFTYDNIGSYTVLVHAHATTGATADLTTTDEMCIGMVNQACDDTIAPCCLGTCTRGLCL